MKSINEVKKIIKEKVINEKEINIFIVSSNSFIKIIILEIIDKDNFLWSFKRNFSILDYKTNVFLNYKK